MHQACTGGPKNLMEEPYESRLNAAERNYPTHDRELLAVMGVE
jgi:hypothetical protein